ncbi:MAG: response regulator [Bacteroidota bacterium]|jgi:CheY-like chemotaxis protein
MTKENRILLVDDDDIHNFITENFITDHYPSTDVVSFNNPEIALEHLKESTSHKDPECPDVIFLDINMPEMNGWQFLENFIKLNIDKICGSKIYILSSSMDPADITRSKQFDIVANFISKPLTAEKVEAILH